MSTKIDANKDRLEATYQWQAFKVNPLLLMGCIVVPLFVGSYAYTSWQQTKNLKQSLNVEVNSLRNVTVTRRVTWESIEH